MLGGGGDGERGWWMGRMGQIRYPVDYARGLVGSRSHL